MTDPLRTPPPAAARLRPFADNPARWDAERSCALQTVRIADGTGSSSAADEPYLVHERTGWGWLAWTVPADGSMPEQPHRIGVLPPAATWADRLAARWLARRPAGRMALHATSRGSLRYCAVVVAVIGCFAAVGAIARGVPLGIAVALALLAPLLADHLPDRLDMCARRRVRVTQGAAATGYLQRLAAWHTGLLRAAAGSDRHEVRRSAEVGRQLLWDAAGLLQTQDTRAASADLIAREQLMLQLAHQVAQILTPAAGDNIPGGNRATAPARTVVPHSAGARTTTPPVPPHAPTPPPQKGTFLMPHPDPSQAVPNVYLLFAHAPYYPAAAREINTTVVSAASLLHPRVRQPDGARIHHCLVHGRRPGEIVPLSTLTHELDGGARWMEVGDWEGVTEDLLQLVRDRDCDALGLGLPDISRALMCAGPCSEVRAVGPTAGGHRAYGPTDRIEVLVEVGWQLAWAEAGSSLWPGDNLLPPINSVASPGWAGLPTAGLGEEFDEFGPV
ncbi:hypothetical protein OG496_00580 [Streptomyces sp. NBC_00988]|uniref:hypothetical protein n=1 Tax=Streptomyces sp. NBC_00988 TaxID=2903704 RepID=UPI0038704EAA|nr:hypothetical protein OG496_00580 [Streptomyces sp. NBC_00988]